MTSGRAAAAADSADPGPLASRYSFPQQDHRDDDGHRRTNRLRHPQDEGERYSQSGPRDDQNTDMGRHRSEQAEGDRPG
jgi:hypothetical protein